MEDLEEKYWLHQKKIYDSLDYPNNIKYYSWQPARWSANAAAVQTIFNNIKDINSVCEVGAGSAAFSYEMYKQNPNLKLTAIDRSKVASIYGKQIAEDMDVSVNYINDDFWNINGENKYDIVLSLGVIEHFDEKEQIEFIKKCIEFSKNYIMVAIPNQDSIIFQSYIKWCNRNNNNYEEEHKALNTQMLESLMEKCGLEVVIVDGFQMYLSESDFLMNTIEENKQYINMLKTALINENYEIGNLYPNYNFKYEDIEAMKNAELSFTASQRADMSFMSYVLCKKR